MSPEICVNEEILQMRDDRRYHLGDPFSGVGYIPYPSGQLKRKIPYRDGFAEGLCEAWFANGQLKEQWHAKRGVVHGVWTAWHENGKLKTVGNYEFGIEVEYDEWNENGELLVARRIGPNSTLFPYLERLRNGSVRIP